MTEPATPPLATLIGDVVSSRSVPDRRRLHRDLEAVLAEVTSRTEPVHALRVTVGDEFQGAWHRRGQAIHAALLLRLALVPIEVRLGLGHGGVASLSEDGTVQDGPGWWLAREAITRAKADEPASRSEGAVVRTRWREDSPLGPALDTTLRHRDLVLGRLDERSLRILRGLVEGRSQRTIATDEGVSPTAVSRRVHRDGLDLLVDLDRELGEQQ